MNLARSSLAAVEAGHHHFGEAVEILLALAAAGIDAEAGGIELAEVEARVGHGLLGGADGEVGVPALILPIVGVLAHIGEVPIADFGGDLGGKVAGVEQGGIAHARLAGQQPPPHGFDIRAQRRNAADAGNYNASSHGSVPLLISSFMADARCAERMCRNSRSRIDSPRMAYYLVPDSGDIVRLPVGASLGRAALQARRVCSPGKEI